ncbi:MAG: precorrin-6A/cobalt-precorrin-6A reductase [Pseudomonadota bacterium]
MRPERSTILVIAGTREAHALLTALQMRRRNVVACLAEPARGVDNLPVPARLGAFDTTTELADWMAGHDVTTVIDAAHAFDTQTSAMAQAVCARQMLRYLRVLRPPWTKTIKDRWQYVSSVAVAARSVPDTARVFANTGRATLLDYANFSGERLFMRQTQRAQTPPSPGFVEFVYGMPPFTQFQEQATFEDLSITHLICRNIGGAASMSKLLAAREMQLPVIMVSRGNLPDHLAHVETVRDALAWEANP